jgi:CheY-like chemotaxis protein
MEMHRGRVWADSEKGKGNTFTFALPRISSAETEFPSQSGGAEEPDGGGEPWDGRTVLIVDDIEHYHEYMKLLMRSAGRLEFAYNGLEAIETARRESPDLILMDLRMPVLDGFQAIERLKSDSATRDIPIIAVTAQAMEEDRVRSAQAGANGYVTKPVDIEVFKNEIGHVLGVRV